MYSVTKRFSFDAAHRVLGHGGKCKHLHGHSYSVEITLASRALDALNMVADFAVIKDSVGAWINQQWDHNVLLNPDDPLLPLLVNQGERQPYVMPASLGNPTAEAMAHDLFDQSKVLLAGYGFANKADVLSVRVYETPTCWADYTPEKFDLAEEVRTLTLS